jgi:hypothetical protein
MATGKSKLPLHTGFAASFLGRGRKSSHKAISAEESPHPGGI